MLSICFLWIGRDSNQYHLGLLKGLQSDKTKTNSDSQQHVEGFGKHSDGAVVEGGGASALSLSSDAVSLTPDVKTLPLKVTIGSSSEDSKPSSSALEVDNSPQHTVSAPKLDDAKVTNVQQSQSPTKSAVSKKVDKGKKKPQAISSLQKEWNELYDK